MSDTPFDLADRFVDDLVQLSPMMGTYLGVGEAHDRWDDLSPEGYAAQADLGRRYREAFARHLDDPDSTQRHAARVMVDHLTLQLDAFDHGDHLDALRHLAGPFSFVRGIFDVMARDDADDWEAITRRLATVDEPLAGFRATLEEGRRRGKVASARQVRSVADQARVLASDEGAFALLHADAQRRGFDPPALADAVAHARAEAAAFADYLEQTYLPDAMPTDGVGEERYVREAERFLGLRLDPAEAYAWGWEEIDRLLGEMRSVAAEIVPGASLREVVELLETDPARAVSSPDEFVAFVERIEKQAVEDLSGVHFDVAPEIREVTVNLSPPGSPLGAHYMAPSEDFSRPGGIWYSLADPHHIPLYQEVSTAYHEGFPGHHLQIGTVMVNRDRLSRAHRLVVWYSGYGEGWALYTEGLMDELGYLENPEFRLGMLASHLFRAARVVVDIGLHVGLGIPTGAPLLAGERWDFDRAVRFMTEVGMQTPDVADSEVKRYLGWPGQAISYKLGEREILRLRDELRRRQGPEFDLKAFHSMVLTCGEVRLDHLREVVLGA